MPDNLSARWLKILFLTPLIDFAAAVLIKDISAGFLQNGWSGRAQPGRPAHLKADQLSMTGS